MPEQRIAELRQEVIELRQVVSDFAVAVGRLEQRLDDLRFPDATQCALHNRMLSDIDSRLDRVEGKQDKQNTISLVVGAVGAAIVMAIKLFFTGGTAQ